jgi:DNA-binding beta-propeller fold protein YncE
MIRLTTSTKLLAAGAALSLGWIVLEACDCDETKEQSFPGFWVSCINNKPTLMTYNENTPTVVSSDTAGNFQPSQYDCGKDSNSPQYKGSESSSPFRISTPSGPGGSARPHAAAGNTYFSIPQQLLSLPFTPFAPPPATPVCQSGFADVLRTNHNYNTVSRLSTCPFAVKATIPVFQNPLQIAVTPDGSTAVVTSFGDLVGDGGAVTFINLSNNKITNTLMMPFSVTPNGLALSPDGTTAYVGNFTSPGQSILVINIPSQTITATIPITVHYPSGMTLTPDGSQLWVASPLGSETDVLDTLSQTTVYRLNIQASVDVAFNSTGTTAYVTSDSSTPGQVFAVDTSTYRILNTYTVGNGPSDISMSYGNQFLVVNNYFDGTVSIIDLKQDKVVTSQFGANPIGISFVQ